MKIKGVIRTVGIIFVGAMILVGIGIIFVNEGEKFPLIEVSPGFKPEPLPGLKPIEFSGQGNSVSPKFTLEEGVAIYTVTHDGFALPDLFVVELLDDAGERVWSSTPIPDTLMDDVSIIGVHHKKYSIEIKPGDYSLNVIDEAKGKWTVLIDQPRPTNAKAPPFKLTGKSGDSVSPFFMLDEGTTNISIDCAKFIGVKLFSTDGKMRELFLDAKSYTVEVNAGMHILQIQADGDWTISISQ